MKEWFANLNSDTKRLTILGFLLVTSAATFGLCCTPILSYVSCDGAGAWAMAEFFFYAAIANQVTYQLTPRNGK